MHSEEFVHSFVLFFQIMVLLDELISLMILPMPIWAAHSIDKYFHYVKVVFVNFLHSVPEVWVFEKKISNVDMLFGLTITEIQKKFSFAIFELLFIGLLKILHYCEL